MLMLDGLRSRLRAVPLQPGTSSRRTTMKVAWSLPLVRGCGKGSVGQNGWSRRRAVAYQTRLPVAPLR